MEYIYQVFNAVAFLGSNQSEVIFKSELVLKGNSNRDKVLEKENVRYLILTVKWRKSWTTSRSVRMPDCAGP